MSNEVSIKLASGVVLTGPSDEVIKLAKNLDDTIRLDQYYFSQSRGEYIRISEMNTVHLRNAVLKMYAEWVEDLRSALSPRDFAAAIYTGPTDPVLINMVRELTHREVWA